MNQEVEAITGNYMLAIGYLSEMRNGVMHYRLDITRGILVRDTGEKAVALQKRLDEWLAIIAANEAKYVPTVETGEKTKLYGEYQAAWKEYLLAAQHTLTLLVQGNNDQALVELAGLVKTGERTVKALAADAEFNARIPSELAGTAADAYATGRFVVLVLLGAAIAIACLVGWLTVVGIARPVQAMTGAMRRLAEKDLQVQIPARGRT